MKELEDKILIEGTVLPGDVLKVGSFLNQQIDVELLAHMADETARLFAGEKITKVLTIEASGIAFATAVALKLGVKMVYAKKHASANVSGELYSTKVFSYTHGKTYDVAISKDYLLKEDKVLIVDDFLAGGNALKGLIDLVEQSGAKVVGACVEIEKAYQGGGDALRSRGYRVESLAKIREMTDKSLSFCS